LFPPASEDTREIAAGCQRINDLLNKAAYTEEDKTEIQLLLVRLGLANNDDGRYAILNQAQGRLLRRPETGVIEIIASGRASWTGGVELKTKVADVWRWEVPFW